MVPTSRPTTLNGPLARKRPTRRTAPASPAGHMEAGSRAPYLTSSASASAQRQPLHPIALEPQIQAPQPHRTPPPRTPSSRPRCSAVTFLCKSGPNTRLCPQTPQLNHLKPSPIRILLSGRPPQLFFEWHPSQEPPPSSAPLPTSGSFPRQSRSIETTNPNRIRLPEPCTGSTRPPPNDWPDDFAAGTVAEIYGVRHY